MCGSTHSLPKTTTPTKFSAPNPAAIVRCARVAREKTYGSSSAIAVLNPPYFLASSRTASTLSNPPPVASMDSNRYTISPELSSTSGAPLNRTSAGRTKLSSSGSFGSRSRYGAS